jgi:hypothetical protein
MTYDSMSYVAPQAPQQQPGPQAAYQAPQAPKPQTAGFAVASLVLGLVGLFVFPIVSGILAIVFGSLRLRAGSAGRGMAIAGFVLGIVGTVGWFVILASAS